MGSTAKVNTIDIYYPPLKLMHPEIWMDDSSASDTRNTTAIRFELTSQSQSSPGEALSYQSQSIYKSHRYQPASSIDERPPWNSSTMVTSKIPVAKPRHGSKIGTASEWGSTGTIPEGTSSPSPSRANQPSNKHVLHYRNDSSGVAGCLYQPPQSGGNSKCRICGVLLSGADDSVLMGTHLYCKQCFSSPKV